MNLSQFPNLLLKSKFADIAALDTGDISKLEIQPDAQIRQKINSTQSDSTPGRNILVLGGNGFVGIHLLNRLLQDERVERVYAIVRSSDSTLPITRLQVMMDAYSLSLNQAQSSKLQCLEGIITADRFGLSQSEYEHLCLEVDTVFQCASSTDYSVSYLDLRDDWVIGLLRIVQFCINGKIKQLTYLGSVIVHLYKDRQDFLRPDSWWYSGYAQMKWVNQNMLLYLAHNGLPITVCEAPYILGSTLVGKDPGLHYSFWRILQTAKNMEMIGDSYGIDFVPVDILTQALVENALSLRPFPVLRPCYPRRYSNKVFAPLLGCKVVSWEEFYANLCKIPHQSLRQIIPANAPEIIDKTRKKPIYHEGFEVNTFPGVETLMSLYLKHVPIKNLAKIGKSISLKP